MVSNKFAIIIGFVLRNILSVLNEPREDTRAGGRVVGLGIVLFACAETMERFWSFWFYSETMEVLLCVPVARVGFC